MLTARDEATGCQHCGHLLGASPSRDFCSEDCQQQWHQRTAVSGSRSAVGGWLEISPLYREIDQYSQAIDVLVSKKQDLAD